MALLASLWGFYVRGSSRLTNMLRWPGLDTVLGPCTSLVRGNPFAGALRRRHIATAHRPSPIVGRGEKCVGVHAYVEDGSE